jgi:hypothetical protein
MSDTHEAVEPDVYFRRAPILEAIIEVTIGGPALELNRAVRSTAEQRSRFSTGVAESATWLQSQHLSYAEDEFDPPRANLPLRGR